MPDELVGELEEPVLEAVAVVEDILRSLWLLENYRDMGRVSTPAGKGGVGARMCERQTGSKSKSIPMINRCEHNNERNVESRYMAPHMAHVLALVAAPVCINGRQILVRRTYGVQAGKAGDA
jgi:hypothetical protein